MPKQYAQSAVLNTCVPILWYGLLSETRQSLASIPADDLKNTAAVWRLENYLERNEGSIPCYALKSLLGLRIASSPVERATNEVTARRQKRAMA